MLEFTKKPEYFEPKTFTVHVTFGWWDGYEATEKTWLQDTPENRQAIEELLKADDYDSASSIIEKLRINTPYHPSDTVDEQGHDSYEIEVFYHNEEGTRYQVGVTEC